MIDLVTIPLIFLGGIVFWDAFAAFIQKHTHFDQSDALKYSSSQSTVPVKKKLNYRATKDIYLANHSNLNCVICYGPINSQYDIRNQVHLVCCESLAHKNHITSWLKIKNICPYCGSKQINLLTPSLIVVN